VARLVVLPGWRALEGASNACRCGRRCPIRAVTGDEPRIQRRRKASRFLSLWALNSRDASRMVCLHDQRAPTAARGTGIGPENSDGMRVLTIAMTAPQQVHKIENQRGQGRFRCKSTL